MLLVESDCDCVCQNARRQKSIESAGSVGAPQRISGIGNQALKVLWKSAIRARIGSEDRVPMRSWSLAPKFQTNPKRTSPHSSFLLKTVIGCGSIPAKRQGNHFEMADNMVAIHISKSVTQ